MNRYDYMCLPLYSIPDKIIVHFKLLAPASDIWVYLKIRKGMPGLKQAGIISNDRLTLHFAKHRYAPVPCTPLLWAQAHLPVMFSLVVNNFDVKYIGDASAHHLIAIPRILYTIYADWSRSLFCAFTLAWDYANRTGNVSMP